MGARIASFESMIAPISLDEFFAKHWEKEPLFIRRSDPGFYDGLLTLQDLQNAISSGGLRYPAIQLSRDGGFLPPEAFCKDIRSGDVVFDGVPELARVQAEYQSGSHHFAARFSSRMGAARAAGFRRRGVFRSRRPHQYLHHAGRGVGLWSAL